MSKKILPLLFGLIIFTKLNAQVVFCPPGAEWHYFFKGSIFSPGSTFNEGVKYTRDSINGADTLKVLKHIQSSLNCGKFVTETLLKQKGDTIFFKNKLTPGWQILYNFSVQAGEAWQTTLYSKDFTTTVTGVGTTTVNGFTLKTLTVQTSEFYGSYTIQERIGSSFFLLNYEVNRASSCDADMFIEPLCYQDNVFGVKQFGSKSCYYYTANYVGLDEKASEAAFVNISPNPASDFLHVDLTGVSIAEAVIIDINGKEIKREKFEKKNDLCCA